MTDARQWKDQRPFEETWFIEALLGPDRGVWLRFHIDATAGEVEVWALVTTPSGVLAAEKQCFPIEQLGDGTFACPAARLNTGHTQGELGEIRWDLQLSDRGARHRHVPWLVRALGIGKTYVPEVLDLRVRGEVRVGEQTFQVSSGPGVLGHIWGSGSRVRRWAWAHCNAFDREDLVFEGLSAGIGPLPPLTSLVFLADGHAYRFSNVRHLIRTWSKYGKRKWVFEARQGSRVLTGHLELDPHAPTVTYPTGGPNRTPAFCTNTRFGQIRLLLTDPSRGLDLDVRSSECAFELVGPEPQGPVLL